MLASKGTKLYSVLHFKCPFCHEGAFFVAGPYDLRHAGDLHKACPVCLRKYEREPGFYWGAMFVSYAFSIAFSLVAFGTTWSIAPNLGLLGYFIVVVGATILVAPYLYALSKITWANFFFSYIGPRSKG